MGDDLGCDRFSILGFIDILNTCQINTKILGTSKVSGTAVDAENTRVNQLDSYLYVH